MEILIVLMLLYNMDFLPNQFFFSEIDLHLSRKPHEMLFK